MEVDAPPIKNGQGWVMA
uniref:Uncharacterized protein n=1 Tax=Arundo donax TaxID=35708 RepID=A0A0A8Y9B4_ARUDO